MRKIKRLILCLAFAVIGLLLFWYIGTFTLTVSRTHIESDKIDGEIKLVQITDLHGAEFSRNNKALIKKIEKENPDLILATGDMYNNSNKEGQKVAEALLISLAEKNTVCYVTGEHDNDEDFHNTLKEGGVKVFDYKVERIKIRDEEVVLWGINNVYYSSTFDLFNEFTPNYNDYNILLAHINNPEDFKSFGADLTLCGDTHGGQIRLPFGIGAVYLDGVWFPEAGGKTAYIKGLYDLGENKLFISSGLGNRPYPIRVFNRPEISVITIG